MLVTGIKINKSLKPNTRQIQDNLFLVHGQDLPSFNKKLSISESFYITFISNISK